MENISFNPDSSLDYKKIKTSTDPITCSDEIVDQITSTMHKFFPKSKEIKTNFVRTITESDDDILDRTINNKISFQTLVFKEK